MIVTLYDPTGKKTRRAIGYAGKTCNQATQPYEAREVPGSARKTPTGEMYQEPADQTVAAETTQQIER